MKVAVVGDSMLDVYHQGAVRRISPEANVPVLSEVNTEIILGGAANVAENLHSLGAEVDYYCRWDTESGYLLKMKIFDIFRRSNLIRKVRFYNGDEYLLRVDCDEAPPLLPGELEFLKSVKWSEYDAIVISDYNKGFITSELVGHISARTDSFIIVDPKGGNLDKYYGVDLITPNISELKTLSGKEDINKGVAYCLDYVNSVLLTKSDEGMEFFEQDKENGWKIYSSQISAPLSNPKTVIGAGDAVVACMTFFLTSGKSVVESLELTNNRLRECMSSQTRTIKL